MVRQGIGANVALSLGVLLALSGPALANINLEWRPATSEALVGQTIDIRLYAVSDVDDADQSIGAISAVMSWDPAHLELQENINNGPYFWLLSDFPQDGQADGLNDTWRDGNAVYKAWRLLNPDPPAWATDDGLLVTTMRFVALAETRSTELVFIEAYSEQSFTVVLHGLVPGTVVTGTLAPASVSILPCGSLGDVNGDCNVDLADYAETESCLLGPDGGLLVPECEDADSDGDGDVDLWDFAVLQASSTG